MARKIKILLRSPQSLDGSFSETFLISFSVYAQASMMLLENKVGMLNSRSMLNGSSQFLSASKA